MDGFSCLKHCHHRDALCLGNHTREILHQFRALPSITKLSAPIEVSRITSHTNRRYGVEYVMDASNQQQHPFVLVEQQQRVGIVKVVGPISGPATITIRIHINIKSQRGVSIAHNLALIEVDIAGREF